MWWCIRLIINQTTSCPTPVNLCQKGFFIGCRSRKQPPQFKGKSCARVINIYLLQGVLGRAHWGPPTGWELHQFLEMFLDEPRCSPNQLSTHQPVVLKRISLVCHCGALFLASRENWEKKCTLIIYEVYFVKKHY